MLGMELVICVTHFANVFCGKQKIFSQSLQITDVLFGDIFLDMAFSQITLTGRL